MRAAVGGRVGLQGFDDGVLIHLEILTHANGSGHILEVVASHEMGLDEVIPPADAQIGIAGCRGDRAEGSAIPAIADAFLSL